MSDDLNTEIKMGVNADGVETGVTKVRRTIKTLADDVNKLGDQTGQGFQKMGAGGEVAGRRLDSVTKNMQASLQRQIAALEAGGTATRQYQESLARMRGADMGALRPFLDQLDAAKAKAEAAARAQGGLIDRLGALGPVASIARAQLAGLVGSVTLAGLVSFVKSVNDGVDALNDIKDATGSSIENISALEDVGKRTGASLETVGGVLIKFNDLLSKAGPKSDIALQLKAIGIEAEELKKLDPAEALRVTAVALSAYADDANKARLIQDLFGKSVKEAAPFLADLAEKGALVAKVTTAQAEEADKFNKELFTLQANASEAARGLAGPMVEAINEVAKAFRDGTSAGKGFWEIAWNRYQEGNKKRWDIVRDGYGAVATAQWNVLRGAVGMAPLESAGASGTWEASGASGSWGDPEPAAGKPSVALPKTAAQLAAEAAAAKKAADEQKKALAELAKTYTELNGLSSSYYEDLAKYQQQRAAGTLSEENYVKAVEQLIAKQPFAIALQKEETEATKARVAAYHEATKAQAAELAERQRRAATVQGDVQRLKDEEEAAEMAASSSVSLAEALQMIALARLEDERAKLIAKGTDGETLLAIQKEVEARKELLGLMGAKAAREANKKAADDAAKEWERTAQTISDTLADYIMAGGKDAATYLKRLFATLVLQPSVQALAGGFAGSGGGAMAGAGGGMMDRIANSGGGLTNWSSWGSGGADWLWNNGAEAINKGWTTLGGNMMDLGRTVGQVDAWLKDIPGFSGGIGSAAGYIGAIVSLSQGKPGAAIGQAIGTYILPGIGTMIGGMLGGLLDGLDGSGDMHRGGTASWSADGGMRTSVSGVDNIDNQFQTGMGWVEDDKGTRDSVSTVAATIGVTLDAMAKAFGQRSGYEVSTGWADDWDGEGSSWGGLRIARDGEELINWDDSRTSKWAPREFGSNKEEGYKEYLAAVAKDTRQVLLDMDLPSWADDILESIGDAADMDALTGAMTQIGQINTAFDLLGKSIDGFADLTDEARAAIMKASGGIEALTANANTFYSSFYSGEERQQKMRDQIQALFTDLGLGEIDFDAPDAQERFRAIVEEQMARANVAVGDVLGSLLDGIDPAALAAGSLDLGALIGSALTDSGVQGEIGQLKEDLMGLAAGMADMSPDEVRDSIAAMLEAAGVTDKTAAETVAALLAISGSFAQVTESADAARERLEREAQAARSQAMNNLQDAMERQREVWDAQLEQIDAQRDAVAKQRSLQSESLSLITGIFDLVRTNARDLYGEVDDAAAMQAAQGRLFIQQALQTAQRTGYLPERDQLSEAIAAARSGLDVGNYSSVAEAEFAKLVLAGQLSALEAITGKQKTDAELQIERMDQQLEALDLQTESINRLAKDQQKVLDYWQRQIDIANGTYDATLTVAEAINAIRQLMFPEVEPGGSGAGGAGGAGGPSYGPTWGGSTTAPKYSRPVSYTGGIIRQGVTAEEEQYLDQFNAGYRAFDGTGDVDGLNRWIVENGLKPSDMSALSGLFGSDWEAWFRNHGMSYDIGTNYVTRTGPAFLHEGEAVIPKPFNPWANGGGSGLGGGSADALLDRIDGRLERLEALHAEGNASTRQLADEFSNWTMGGSGAGMVEVVGTPTVALAEG